MSILSNNCHTHTQIIGIKLWTSRIKKKLAQSYSTRENCRSLKNDLPIIFLKSESSTTMSESHKH